MLPRLTALDYAHDTLSVAQNLLGCLLVRRQSGQRLSGIIVETEAYLADGDTASHSHVGLKKRNAAMFQPAGTLYVYSIHAKYCMNVVTEPAETGAAVLLRALQPWEGIEQMQVNRQAQALRDLCTGPARLCQAMNITTAQDKIDLISSNEIWIEPPLPSVIDRSWRITRSSRIGLSSAQELPYRFFIDGHICVSGLARLHQAKREWSFAP